MSNIVELPIIGEATVKVLANLRQGAPSLSAPVINKLTPGDIVEIAAFTSGDAVQGNANWLRLNDGGYLWSGACGSVTSGAGGTAAPKSSALGSTPALNPVPMVVDLYHGDGVTSFAAARNSGVFGIIHKATTGATGRDDAYHDRRKAAKDAGLLWGAYHWGTAAPIADQVTNFLNWADPDDQTLVALDFEAAEGNQMTLDGARQFCQLIFDKLKRRPVLYSGSLFKSALGQTVDPFFKDYRLWLAQYGANPTVQPTWQSYWLWQYTDGQSGPGTKTVPGIPGDTNRHVDCNFFKGTAEELTLQWAG